MPLISVIVPVYKVEPYLNECIESILNQTFTDFELILVDDGSPDNCPKICDDYAKKDNRVIVIHKENGGLSSARNVGLDYAFENSTSEYVSFVDSDDYVDRCYLCSLLNGLRTSDISFSNLIYVDEHGKYLSSKGEIKTLNRSETLSNISCNPNFIVAQGKLVKKSFYKDVRFPLGKIYEDEYVCHKVLGQATSTSSVGFLYYYRQRNESIMHSTKIIVGLYCYLEAIIDRFQYLVNSSIFLSEYIYDIISISHQLIVASKKEKNTKLNVEMLIAQAKRNLYFVKRKEFGKKLFILARIAHISINLANSVIPLFK